MRYFFRLTSISLQSHLYYKTSFLLNLLTPIVLLFGQYMLWGALYGQQSGTIGSMTQREMFTYILIAFSLNNLLGWSSETYWRRRYAVAWLSPDVCVRFRFWCSPCLR